MSRTGIILASGQGSRLRAVSEKLGIPKHLFPVGDKSLLERTATELSKHCDQIVVITKEEDREKFEQEISKFPFSVEVFVKSQDGFRGDFIEAYRCAKNKSVVITVGDLIFPDNEIAKFIKRADKACNKMVVAFDRTTIFKIRFPTVVDFRLLMAVMPKEMLKDIIELDPESPHQVLFKFLKLLIKKKLKPVLQKSLFNINTPESYESAKKYFENS